jgi:hypothetical protein
LGLAGLRFCFPPRSKGQPLFVKRKRKKRKKRKNRRKEKKRKLKRKGKKKRKIPQSV